MGEIYYEQPRINGKCSVCGKTGQERSSKNPKFFKRQYWSVFEKVNWFRGDDEYLGKICKDCVKAGFINKVVKQVPGGKK